MHQLMFFDFRLFGWVEGPKFASLPEYDLYEAQLRRNGWLRCHYYRRTL
jgi:hypothetical protein